MLDSLVEDVAFTAAPGSKAELCRMIPVFKTVF